ncbi:MAG: DNA-directed RNA polymerase subunit omega [Eubacteriales bacterium]
MLHPSYTELMKVVNSEVVEGAELLVNSRYSIVMATSKRARQIVLTNQVAREKGFPVLDKGKKPLSTAIEELNASKIKIIATES